ncbi:MAG TPA: hypothetical protein PKY78_00515, partial [Candidatus Omnitrophota bacterium]|nr:hypothetical protein [Candidatus Omnitrophota bacterium]
MKNLPTVAIKTLLLLGIAILLPNYCLADTYDYYSVSKRLKSVTYDPPQNFISFLHYVDENWNSLGYGRVDQEVRTTAGSDGALSYSYSYPAQNLIVVGDINGDGKDDLVIDFGSAGLYKFINNTFIQIGTNTISSMVVGDLDNNGKDDVILNYASKGIYKYANNGTMTKISNTSAENLAVADLDGNGQSDILIDYGTAGFYKYMNNSTMVKIGATSPDTIDVGDLDNNGQSDLIINYGSAGLFKYVNNSTMTKIGSACPVTIKIGDLDGNGCDDVILDYGSSVGLYKYMNNSSMIKIGSSSATSLLVGDIDGNGQDDLIVNYGTTGLFKYMNNSTMVKIGSASPSDMQIADLDGNGQADIIINYGTAGLYKYMNNSAMVLIKSSGPTSIKVADLDGDGKDDLVLDYGTGGVFTYTNNSTLTQISTLNTDRVTIKYAYANNDFTNLIATYEYSGNDTTGKLIKKTLADGQVFTYYNDATNYLESKTLSAADANGIIYYHYANENFNSLGYGRVDYARLAAFSSKGEIAFKYTYYASPNGAQAEYVYSYSDVAMTVLVGTYNYATDGSLIKFTPVGNIIEKYTSGNIKREKNATTSVIKEYFDENWNSQGFGRVSLYYDPALGKYSTYIWDASQVLVEEYAGTYVPVYGSDAASDVNAVEKRYTYIYDHKNEQVNIQTSSNGWILRQKIVYDTDGVTMLEAYVYDGTGRLELDYYVSSDKYYTYEYYSSPNENVVKSKNEYQLSSDKLLFTYEYDTAGQLVSKITYYYGTGNIESKTLMTADANGNIYYHYIDSTSALVDWVARSSADSFGAYGYYYEYYEGTSVKSKATGYLGANYADPSNPKFKTAIVTIEYDTTGKMTAKYTYYSDTGYIESKTLVTADTTGNIYYHYVNGTGSAMDKKVLASADSQGVIAYSYEYYSGTTKYKKVIGYASGDYSDPKNPAFTIKLVAYEYATDGTTIDVKYTYYNNANNYLQSKTLRTADTYGNVYYFYADDASSLLSKKVLAVADKLGATGYDYEYYAGTSACKKSTGYAVADYSDATNPVFSTRIITYEFDTDGTTVIGKYTYYNNANNRLESKTYSTADASGNFYYHYADDSLNLMDKKVMASSDSMGAYAYYYEYYAGTSTKKKEVGYKKADYSNPSNPDLLKENIVVVYEYSAAGAVTTKYTYYADTGYLESTTLLTADTYGNVYYHYINGSSSLMDRKVLSAADSEGAIAYFYTYTATNKYKTVDGYAIADYADPKNPSFTRKVRTYEYAADGTTVATKYTYYNDADNRMESKTLKTADAGGNVYYHFSNTALNLMDKKVLAAADSFGATGYEYVYYDGTNKYKTVTGYASADYSNVLAPVFSNRIVTYEYATDGTTMVGKYTYYNNANNRLESKTYNTADSAGNIYYHYADTTLNLLDKKVLASADSFGATGYYYEYFSGTSKVSKVVGYKNADYADPTNPDFTGIVVVLEYDESGNVAVKYTYYSDTGYLESKTLASADKDGNIYYHYTNTAANLMDKKVMGKSDADGAIAYSYEYYDGTSKYKKVTGYASADYSDPKNPSLSSKVRVYEYAADGTTVTTKYSYYNNAANRLESKTMSTADSAGNVYYHYADTELNLMDKKVLGTVDSIGATGYEYEYYAGTNNVKSIKGYAVANYSSITAPAFSKMLISSSFSEYGVLQEQIKYFNDDNNRMASKIESSGDFIKGINLPWMYYGHDIGSKSSSDGFSAGTNEAALINALQEFSGDTVRVFLFNDLRDVIDFSGDTLKFYDEEKLYADMDALLDAAAQTGTKIMPVLFDYWLAYGSTSGDSGHPEVIKDATKRAQLISLISEFIKHYQGRTEISMWDMMNEPYYGTSASPWGNQNGTMSTVTTDEMRTFLQELIAATKTSDPGKQVTIGFANKETLVNYWSNFVDGSGTDDVDIVQIHYYAKYYSYSFDELSYLADSTIFGGKPVLIGELDPQYFSSDDPDAAERLNMLAAAGYMGGLYWQDNAYPSSGDLQLTDEDMEKFSNWFYGTKYTYYNSELNGIESKILSIADASGNVYYHYKDEASSRMDRKVMATTDSAGAIAYYYEYFGTTNVISKMVGYANADYSTPGDPKLTNQVLCYEYEADGDLSVKYTYYTSGNLESKTLAAADTFGNIYYHYTDSTTIIMDKK